VIAVSKDEWVKDFGADYIISKYDKVVEKVNDITNSKMADVVINSVGIGTWESCFESVGANGRLVTFGGLTGADVKLNVQSLYTRQIKLIGSSRGTSGTRAELKDLINFSKELKTKVWKRFKLDETKEAIQALFAKEKAGRIMLEIKS
jgi:NADPH:quinone reductase-like Zn-dependent oxidoreductase